MPIIDRSNRKMRVRTRRIDGARPILSDKVTHPKPVSPRDLLHAKHAALPPSHLPDRIWQQYERIALDFYGRDDGKDVFKLMRVAEHDFDLACEYLCGVKPLPWQSKWWNEGLNKHPFNVALLGNAGGKTTGFGLYYLIAGTFHCWAQEWWGLYGMLHHGPLESHALETRNKIEELRTGYAREQAFAVPGGWDHRPFLLEPFLIAAKQDEGKHEGYEWRDTDGMPLSYLAFLSTAHGASGSDGKAPMVLGEDELRHEKHLTDNLNTIFLPRAIRAPGMRIILPATPLYASVEIVALHARGMDRENPENRDWYSMNLGLREANPGLREQDIQQAERNIPKHLLAMVRDGKAIQPRDAKFSMRSVDTMYEGTTTPIWLNVLAKYDPSGKRGCPCRSCEERSNELEAVVDEYGTVRDRIERRCAKCQAKKQGLIVEDHEEHPTAAGLDPATSAGFDSIVATIWDLEPPRHPAIWAEVVYIEELAAGSRVQDVAAHLTAISTITRGEAGFDRKSGVGHALKDMLVEVEGDFVELATTTKDAKDEWLDYLGALMDLEKIKSPYHLPTKSQTVNYKRDDKGLDTDFLMAQVICAQVAMSYFPEILDGGGMVEDNGDAEEVGYMGLGMGAEAFAMPMGDPMMTSEAAVRGV